MAVLQPALLYSAMEHPVVGNLVRVLRIRSSPPLRWLGRAKKGHFNPVKKDTRFCCQRFRPSISKQVVSCDIPLRSNQLSYEAFGEQADIMKEGRKVVQHTVARHRIMQSVVPLSQRCHEKGRRGWHNYLSLNTSNTDVIADHQRHYVGVLISPYPEIVPDVVGRNR